MGMDPYRKAQRGSANLKGIAMVFGAVVLGLLLSASVLWHETEQRAAVQAASAAAEPAPSGATAEPSPTAAAATATVAKPAPTPAHASASPAAAAPTKAPAATTVPAAVPSKPAGAPAVASAGLADEGSKIFAATCNSCHPNANAGLGPSLKGVPADVITKTVRSGKDMMPSFSTSEVSDEQLQDIVAYLTSLK